MSSNVVLDGLDPDARKLWEMAQGRPAMQTLSLQQARDGFRTARRNNSPDPPEVAELRDFACPGPGGPIPLRSFRGTGTATSGLPGVLYFHGGGWVVGDLDSHDSYCRLLANAARCVVVAVDYRLAPEHPFPAAIEDGVAALSWISERGAELGIDRSRIVLAGDSAGGNVAAVTALEARDAGRPALRGQILLYPVVDATLSYPSYERRGEGFTLTREGMAWFCEQYVPDARRRTEWRVSPIFVPSLRGLPAAFVVTAGHDPLCDEGEAYARRLEADGVRVVYRHFPGQMHGFAGSGRIVRVAAELMREVANFISTA